MLRKKNSVKIKSILLLVTISLIIFQFLIINNTPITTNAASGKVVGFEESHIPITCLNATNNGQDSPGRYFSFAEQLLNHSYTIETIDEGETLNHLTLQDYDIIITVAAATSYTAEEITEIDTWVKGGGSLLIITDWDIYGDGVRSLARNFGFDYPYHDGLRDSDDLVGNDLQFYIDTDNIVAHDITAGVNRIEIYAATGLNETAAGTTNLIGTDNNDTTTWDTGGYANNIPVLSALAGGAAGNGKVVIITDYNIWDGFDDIDSDGDNDFFDSDNEKLALNIINWLAIRTIPTSIDFFSLITILTLASIVIIKRKRK